MSALLMDQDMPPPPPAAPTLGRAVSSPPLDVSAAQRRMAATRIAGRAMAIRVPAPAASASAGEVPSFVKFKEHLVVLVEMGFPKHHAEHALFRTGNRGVPEALAWIEDHPPGDEETGGANLGGEAEQLGLLPPTGPTLAKSMTAPPAMGSTTVPNPLPLVPPPVPSPLVPGGSADSSVVNEEPSGMSLSAVDHSKGTNVFHANDQQFCGICWEPLTNTEPDNTAVGIPGCGHTFCETCVAGWLRTNVMDGNVKGTAMRCPLVSAGTCTRGEMVPDEVCTLIRTVKRSLAPAPDAGPDADPELLAKYQKFLRNREIENNPRAKWCPNPGCDTALVQPWYSVQRGMRCPECNINVCMECGRPFHGWATSCEQVVDAALAEFNKKKHLQPCPNCQRPVEKLDACPHMSCPCGHQWCWVCRGPFPCSMMHFGVTGSGSGEDIGDVLWVQRLTVLTKMVSICCFLPWLALVLSLSMAGWGVVLAVVLGLTLCWGCVAVVHHSSRATGHAACKSTYDGMTSLVKWWWCEDTTICDEDCPRVLLVLAPFLIVIVLGLLVVAFGLLTVASCLLLLPMLGFLAVDLYKCVTTGHCSMDLRVTAMAGEDSIRQYQGDLPREVWAGARVVLAGMISTLSCLPTVACSLVMAPLAPCGLCPLLCNPRGPMPRFLVLLTSLALGVGGTLVVSRYALGIALEDLAQSHAGEALGLFAAVTLAFFVFLSKPPTSGCAFCGPTWCLVYSFPATLVLGVRAARQKMAFAPVPDFCLQLPMLCVTLILDFICKCRCTGEDL